jgi:hypothetical protein
LESSLHPDARRVKEIDAARTAMKGRPAPLYVLRQKRTNTAASFFSSHPQVVFTADLLVFMAHLPLL